MLTAGGAHNGARTLDIEQSHGEDRRVYSGAEHHELDSSSGGLALGVAGGRRGTPTAAAAAAAVLVCAVPGALAGSGGETIEFNHADQEAAQGAIVQRADLRSK